ncbi:hypothetical protein [Streptomyces ziwulingensis]|uniref:Histidine kinase n=1 Tax=Streptomyces ziwulingensis TaxID=1045501 RepID=A0ABP9D0A4_9ACTN
MDLNPYVESLRRELVTAADTGDAAAVAERLSATLTSATRLTLLEALTDAAEEITRDLAPGSVEVRLRGRDPHFVVVSPCSHDESDAAEDTEPPGSGSGAPSPLPLLGKDSGPVARINFRPPQHLMDRIETVAAEQGLSVNAWLIRASSAAVEGGRSPRRGRRDAGRGGHFTGWVG